MIESEIIDVQEYQKNLDNLEVLRTQFSKAIQTFPIELREEKLFWDEWSLKALLAHFSGWALLTLSGIQEAENLDLDIETRVIPWLGEEEEQNWFNEDEVKARHNLSFEEVLAEFIDSQTKLHDWYKRLVSEQSSVTTEEFLSICVEGDVEHYATHLEDLYRVIDFLQGSHSQDI